MIIFLSEFFVICIEEWMALREEIDDIGIFTDKIPETQKRYES